MPSSNSTRKVAKAARSSGKRTSSKGAGRSLAFPIALGLIILVGIVVIVAGRDQRVEATATQPQIGAHWHAAYGIYICDNFISPLTDQREDTRGIHTHADGIIHTHPFSSIAAGKKANLDNFFWMTDVEVTNDKIVLPGGETWENGKTCPNGKAGKVVLAKWENADDAEAAPEIITSDIPSVRFDRDRMAFTLAFVPEDEIPNIPRPESIPTLDNLSDVEAPQAPATSAPATGATDTTATTAPATGATDTTAPGATAPTETTAPATTAAGSG
jgi:hypothetical protein